MSIFNKCNHEWEIIVNEYEKSSLQKILEIKKKFKGDGLSGNFFIGKKIVILQCKKCGALDKTIESV